MGKHFSTMPSIVWLPHRFSVGKTFHKFYEGLKEKKIWGNICSKCGITLVPPRSFCPRCFSDMDEWVEVSQEGRIISWAVATKEYHGAPLKTPFIVALIRLDGTDCNFLPVIGEVDIKDVIKKGNLTGKRVIAVWAEERNGSMLDIAYFKPVQ